MTPHVTVVGSANIDMTFRMKRLPILGETVFGSGFVRGFGGKGANQAVAIARLGAVATFIGRVGKDDFGGQMYEHLAREQIDVTHLSFDETQPTGTAAILVDEHGENSIVVVPGANMMLTASHVRTAAADIQKSVVVLAQHETPFEATIEAFRIARTAGRLCLLNPAPALDPPEELLKLTDICIPNESELRHLTGCGTDSMQDVRAAAAALRARGPLIVIVTLGERGAFVLGPDIEFEVAGISVQAVDTSGAGDAFCGALACDLAHGMGLTEAVKRANAVAAMTVTRAGTQASFPRRAHLP